LVVLAIPARAFPEGRTPATAVEFRAEAASIAFTTTNWTKFRFDAAGTGLNPYETVLSPATVPGLTNLWTRAMPGYVVSSPAVVNGIVYVSVGPVGLNSAYLYAVDAATGQALWRRKLALAGFASDPTVANGVVYVGSLGDHRLHAYDAATGAARWTFEAVGAVSDPVVVGKVLYVGVNSGLVDAIDARNGHELWETSPFVGAIQSVSLAVAGDLVYVGSDDHNLYAFDRRDGHKVWSSPTNGNVSSSPAVAGGRVFVGSGDGNVYAFDQATGALRWAAPTGYAIGFAAPILANGVVYIGSRDNTMYAIDAFSGQVLWTYVTGDIIGDSAAVADGVLYFGSFDKNLYAFHLG
jgi:outer membrane protein assembly factor BamB